MANLSDIKEISESLIPLIKNLFSKARVNVAEPDRSKELALVARLQRFNAEANQQISDTGLVERATAIVASHTALTEILVEATAAPSVVSDADLLAVRVQRDALSNSLGRVLELAAFNPIARLLDDSEIGDVRSMLDRISADITARAEAKAVLDNIIDVATTVAKIAAKLAVL